MTENPEMFFARKQDSCQSVKEDQEGLQKK